MFISDTESEQVCESVDRRRPVSSETMTQTFRLASALVGLLSLGACSSSGDGARPDPNGSSGGSSNTAGTSNLAGTAPNGGTPAVGGSGNAGSANAGTTNAAGSNGMAGSAGSAPQAPHSVVSMGYVGQLTGDANALDYSAVTYVIQGFYSADAGSGAISDVWNVDQYASAGLRAKAKAAGTGVVLSLGGSNHSAPLKQIAKSPQTTQALAKNIVAKLNADQLAGVDLDIEFPEGGNEPEEHYNLVATVYDAVKANNPKSIVVFGVSPGYWLDQYQWAKLASKTDYAFYFCYDWSNPANGPMINEGSDMQAIGGAHFEASCRGAMNFMIAQGYPAEKIIAGFGFYASDKAPYANIPADLKTKAPDPQTMEVMGNGNWWPNAASIKMKIDAVLSTEKTVLSGGKTAGGVGFWEWGYENPAAPDLSQAMKQQMALYKK